jgi:hypothetical protein
MHATIHTLRIGAMEAYNYLNLAHKSFTNPLFRLLYFKLSLTKT